MLRTHHDCCERDLTLLDMRHETIVQMPRLYSAGALTPLVQLPHVLHTRTLSCSAGDPTLLLGCSDVPTHVPWRCWSGASKLQTCTPCCCGGWPSLMRRYRSVATQAPRLCRLFTAASQVLWQIPMCPNASKQLRRCSDVAAQHIWKCTHVNLHRRLHGQKF
jgi:hypothetical protein